MICDTLDRDTHVRPEMRAFLAIGGRERLKQCWDKVLVPTPGLREAFAAMTDCLDAPLETKPRGLIITGEADTGKSRAMVAFRDRHPKTRDENSEFATCPVVYVQAPDSPSKETLLKAILNEVGFPIRCRPKDPDLVQFTVNTLRNCRVGTIMIDELHNIEPETLSKEVVAFLRFLKSFINALGRPLVVGGTPIVRDLLRSEDQIAGRFKRVVQLKPLKIDHFALTVLSFEKLIPLRRPSDFKANEDIIQFLYSATGGLIGNLSYLLHDACQLAIDSGEERITLHLLQKVHDRSLSPIGRG
jgi:hypothetical protein